jgi:SAM-dependent methyltransferase
MPTVGENAAYWGQDYQWKTQGDEWSAAWGGPSMHWQMSLYPRLRPLLPARRIVEIAPGQGRWTSFLLGYCDEYIGVDLSDTCIRICQERFKSDSSAKFFVNDGRSLPMVDAGAADLVFSFDSLVHVEADVMRAYVDELTVKLSDDGVAFLHHSNLGDDAVSGRLVDQYAGRLARAIPRTEQPLRKLDILRETHWRAPSMSAGLLEQMCRDAGLRCVGQEIVNWGGRSLIDCLSLVARPGSRWDRPNVVVRNSCFMEEAQSAGAAQRVFGTLAAKDPS